MLESVQAGIHEQLERREVGQRRLAHLNGRNPLAMRQLEGIEHTAQLIHFLAFSGRAIKFGTAR